MEIKWLPNAHTEVKSSDRTPSAPLTLRTGDRIEATVLAVDQGRDALVAFGQFKAYARLPLAVVAGQTIQMRVDPTEQGLRMVMLPAGAAKGSTASGEALPIALFETVSDQPIASAHSHLLIPGDRVSGRITGFEKEGLHLVDFGRFKAFVKIDLPVHQGQTIPLTVLKSGQELVFSVDTTAPAAASSPASLPAASAEGAVRMHATMSTTPPPTTSAEMALLREAIQRLLGPVDPAIPPSGVALSPSIRAALINLLKSLAPASATGESTSLTARVKDFVENSGLYFEKRLEAAIRDLQERPTPMTLSEMAKQPVIRHLMAADIKPNLLILKQFMENEALDPQRIDRTILETLKGVVQRTLAHITQQQVGATERPVDPSLFQAFSHPLMLTETRRDMRLKVYYAKKKRGEDGRNPRVALLLEMDRMGPVRADLWMVGKDLSVTFYVRTANTKAAIDRAQHQVREMLKDTFNTVAINTVVSTRKIVQFDGDDLTIPQQRQVDLNA